MEKPEFVYVTYIATSPERLWRALIDADLTAKYWQHVNVSDWQPGSKWEHRDAGKNGNLRLVGRVIESAPPRRLVLTWADPADEAREEKATYWLLIKGEPYHEPKHRPGASTKA